MPEDRRRGGDPGKVRRDRRPGTLLFFFFPGLGTAGLLADGKRLYLWLRSGAPIRPAQFDRLAGAFTETGRDLFFYVGLTCLTQGVLCTLTFAALGVPRPQVLGFVSRSSPSCRW